MTVENTTIKSRIKNLLRSPSIKLRRSKAGNNKENLSNKVTLEKVLGITSAGNRALACDPRSGLVAYPAGCVVVLLNPKKNKQHHILNSSRKTITTVSFSPDGKYVVTGESGHMPAVRVWDVAERTQVAELHEHKYGVACVAFSPNSKYIVSVGYQHDMIVNVWAWKKNVVVAANKVSSKVTAVSFSDDSSYFVTAGNRHVKFWYLDHTKSSKMNATVPLLGRSGLLGELRNNFFSDVACGKGRKANSTFCITSSGLLCEFNDKRMLDKWVELRALIHFFFHISSLYCHLFHIIFMFYISSDFICGLCIVHYSACVWSVEVYPETRDGEPRLSPGSFLSCSSDNTIRLWNTDAQNTISRNVISNDLQKVIYMDSNTSSLLDTECTISSNSEKVDPQTSDNRTGIRTICMSPDGLHLASGDRNGTLRIHDLESMEEILDVQAHDSEILCLEYSKPETGLKLLATASRDRLIHVLDADQEYSLLQTLDEHSSSITAVRFAANDGKVRMISCGADKSIYFRTAQKTEEGTAFTRAHHIVRKTTLYDMDVDPTQKYAVIGCQDRSIRFLSLSYTTPSSNPGAVHLPNSIVQPVTAVCLNTSETPDQIELSMVLVPSQTKNLTEDKLHSHTEPRKKDTSEAECPPMSQCSLSVRQSSSGSQDSGLLGHQPSLVASSVLLRLGLSKHFFNKGLLPLSSSTSTITSFISSSPSPPINYYHLQDTSLSVDSCRLVANELQSSFKRASQLYKMLSNSTDSSEEQQEMACVLAEAFEAMRDELNCLPPCTPSRSPSTCTVRTLANSDATIGDDRTLALLEQYSKLLLTAVEKRMDNKI
ncbi:mitogen-activated protein kinase-binding protein 1-like [Sinocyclocheilus grahami]|uniref:mitogen-activated protein kinase-binding protein 1-like n=1 Tax=Sinocyclocheilus grahami TaxID=75366 RepID=UPI0007ACBB21|nr:PREDICTED: mitogen-activated protein kinase-binding protein 1-like [Sinocyclocheilus grahami]